MTPIALILALEITSHVGPLPRDLGEVQTDFRGTRWKAVAGQKGLAKVEEATVVFSADRVVVFFQVSRDHHIIVASYRISAVSEFPVLFERGESAALPRNGKGRLRQEEGRYVLEMEAGLAVEKGIEPPGKLRLVLKRVK